MSGQSSCKCDPSICICGLKGTVCKFCKKLSIDFRVMDQESDYFSRIQKEFIYIVHDPKHRVKIHILFNVQWRMPLRPLMIVLLCHLRWCLSRSHHQTKSISERKKSIYEGATHLKISLLKIHTLLHTEIEWTSGGGSLHWSITAEVWAQGGWRFFFSQFGLRSNSAPNEKWANTQKRFMVVA